MTMSRLWRPDGFCRLDGFERKSHKACCYVLIGYRGDTMEAAEKRLRDAWKAGFIPYAMLYRDEKGIVDSEWRKFSGFGSVQPL